MIHVSGVGLLGSFILCEMELRGIEFTWDDNETQFNAWSACTGAIIPNEPTDNSPRAVGYRFWLTNLARFNDHIEPVSTYYVQKEQPSRVRERRLKAIILSATNRWWVEPFPAYQLDTDGFVRETRRRYAAMRSPPTKGATIIRAHGCLEEINRPTTVWGWRIAVRLTFKAALSTSPRPVIHFNDPNRTYERYYFHPVARTDLWWAGSEAVMQAIPRSMPTRLQAGIEKFQDTVSQRFRDVLDCVYLDQTIAEGWRPKPRKVHLHQLGFCYQIGRNVWVSLPLYKSGVQVGPLAAREIVRQIVP